MADEQTQTAPPQRARQFQATLPTPTREPVRTAREQEVADMEAMEQVLNLSDPNYGLDAPDGADQREATGEATPRIRRQATPDTGADADAEPEADEELRDAEPEQDAATEEAEADAEAEPQEQDAPADDDTVEVPASLDDWAEQLGVDPVALSESVAVKVKVNGEEKLLPLKDVVRGYAMEADYTRKSQELANQVREVESTKQASLQERQQSMQILGGLLQRVEAMVGAEVQVDPSLERDDPQEFLIQARKAEQRMGQFNQVKADLGQAYQAHQAQEAAAHQQWIGQQRDALFTAVPAWKDDPVKGDREINDMLAFVRQDKGFSSEETAQPIFKDARGIQLIREWVELKTEKGKAKSLKKRLTKLPKVVQSGARRDDKGERQDRAASARKRLHRTGAPKDFEDAIEAGGFLDDISK